MPVPKKASKAKPKSTPKKPSKPVKAVSKPSTKSKAKTPPKKITKPRPGRRQVAAEDKKSNIAGKERRRVAAVETGPQAAVEKKSEPLLRTPLSSSAQTIAAEEGVSSQKQTAENQKQPMPEKNPKEENQLEKIEALTDKVIGDYNASQIQVLEGLEAVRKRPGMYVGDNGKKGLHQMFREVLDNSVEEALAGDSDHIIVTLSDDGPGTVHGSTGTCTRSQRDRVRSAHIQDQPARVSLSQPESEIRISR